MNPKKLRTIVFLSNCPVGIYSTVARSCWIYLGRLGPFLCMYAICRSRVIHSRLCFPFLWSRALHASGKPMLATLFVGLLILKPVAAVLLPLCLRRVGEDGCLGE